MDANVLEQLVLLQPEEAQLAAVTRLLSLKDGMKAENLTSSLAGTLRTIRKYGYKNLNNYNNHNDNASAAADSKPAAAAVVKQNAS